jgi:hypothetical protein
MNKQKTIKLFREAFTNLRSSMLANQDFKNEQTQTKSKKYDQNSMIRRYGSEHYFKAALYAELVAVFAKENMVVSVERKFPELEGKQKEADIVIWNKSATDPEPHAIIELKVTGTYYWEPRKNKGPEYLADLEIYNNNDYLKGGNTLFIAACYYESNPSEILNLERPLRERFSNLELDNTFNSNIIEAYAFQGATADWIIIE